MINEYPDQLNSSCFFIKHMFEVVERKFMPLFERKKSSFTLNSIFCLILKMLSREQLRIIKCLRNSFSSMLLQLLIYHRKD